MAPMQDNRYPVGTVEGHLEVTPLFSILHASIGPTPMLVMGGVLFDSIKSELQEETKFGFSVFPIYTGRAKLTCHYLETGWDTFPVVILDITAYTFADDRTKKEVAVNRPLIGKIEMELFYNDGGTQVVRLLEEQNPAIIIDLENLHTLHKMVNLLPIPIEYDRNELPPPAIRLQDRINRLWEKFTSGLEKHGLWSEPADDPATKK
jgi:hypothetical protein